MQRRYVKQVRNDYAGAEDGNRWMANAGGGQERYRKSSNTTSLAQGGRFKVRERLWYLRNRLRAVPTPGSNIAFKRLNTYTIVV